MGNLTRSDELFVQAGSILDRAIESVCFAHSSMDRRTPWAIPCILDNEQVAWSGALPRSGSSPLGEESSVPSLGDRRGQLRGGRHLGTVQTQANPTAERFITRSGRDRTGSARTLRSKNASNSGRPPVARSNSRNDSTQQGNWADLKDPSGRMRFESAWRNGAPGIALARCSAVLDPGRREDYLAMARAGLATTRPAIEQKLASPRCDERPATACRDRSRSCSSPDKMLDDSSYRDHALASAERLDRPPCRSERLALGPLFRAGQTHRLMLGTAGIGYTFLRLYDPNRVPSALLLVP